MKHACRTCMRNLLIEGLLTTGERSAGYYKQRDDHVLWASCCIFTAILIGIVFLMTVKPGLVGSLATIVVALALGLITSVVPGRRPAMRKAPSL